MVLIYRGSHVCHPFSKACQWLLEGAASLRRIELRGHFLDLTHVDLCHTCSGEIEAKPQ